jgi:molybdopterin/thiamine biosynthesis adenylyltransferase
MLTPNERERYDRQLMIGEIGEQGQEKLKRNSLSWVLRLRSLALFRLLK